MGDRILAPVHEVNDIDRMSASQYREYTNKLDHDSGVKPPRSPRAEHDMESMFAAWFESAAGTGFGVFENQTRADVKRLLFEHLDDGGSSIQCRRGPACGGISARAGCDSPGKRCAIWPDGRIHCARRSTNCSPETSEPADKRTSSDATRRDHGEQAPRNGP